MACNPLTTITNYQFSWFLFASFIALCFLQEKNRKENICDINNQVIGYLLKC